ncbi:hypothetical protein RHMOL_Rhmol06G0157600 [Rhododendron molle]|uniref:Uncharacterized protein n=1 Tax=Rhododendron molle TaxID=49168 RepID=A0ACC0NCN0_RHOML|nr:hypothetical protein RHMOL_Rhmol06G0157600 [Rhododendron molle]
MGGGGRSVGDGSGEGGGVGWMILETSWAGCGGGGGGFSGYGDLPESGDSCWMDEDPVAVAHFMSYCEKRRGFQRLNLAMKGRWNDRTVDDALGMPAQHICGSYVSQKHLPVD